MILFVNSSLYSRFLTWCSLTWHCVYHSTCLTSSTLRPALVDGSILTRPPTSNWPSYTTPPSFGRTAWVPRQLRTPPFRVRWTAEMSEVTWNVCIVQSIKNHVSLIFLIWHCSWNHCRSYVVYWKYLYSFPEVRQIVRSRRTFCVCTFQIHFWEHYLTGVNLVVDF